MTIIALLVAALFLAFMALMLLGALTLLLNTLIEVFDQLRYPEDPDIDQPRAPPLDRDLAHPAPAGAAYRSGSS